MKKNSSKTTWTKDIEGKPDLGVDQCQRYRKHLKLKASVKADWTAMDRKFMHLPIHSGPTELPCLMSV